MEFELDLVTGLEEENNSVSTDRIFSEINEDTLVPKTGSFLGLDISEHSAGICIYENGKRSTYNSVLNFSEKSVYKEVLLRRELKVDLLGLISGKQFDAILIEDAFQGVNPYTTRLLYALNTAIDELILDGEVTCKEFLRVQNGTWKSWLYVLDSNGTLKGMKDKLKVQKCLESIGIFEEGKGYQDRLDATGLVIGYLLCRDKASDLVKSKKKKRVTIEDVGMCYIEDSELLSYEIEDGIEDIVYLKQGERLSKSKMLDYLTNQPNTVFISSEPVKLGRLASELKLPYIEGGGYLAFWVKSSKYKKYKENLEV